MSRRARARRSRSVVGRVIRRGRVDHNLKVRENGVRAAAIRAGYRLKKTARRDSSALAHHGYMLVDPQLALNHERYVVLGAGFSASLDDVETYLAGWSAGRKPPKNDAAEARSSEGSHDDDVRFADLMERVRASHQHLAAFARQAFASTGRGAVQVIFREPTQPARTTHQTIDGTAYYTIEEIRRLVRQSPNADASPLLRMLESYDPERQAVVLAAFPTSTPTSFKMRLDAPLVLKPTDSLS